MFHTLLLTFSKYVFPLNDIHICGILIESKLPYMGGISQDVKRLKCGIFTLYPLDYLDHLHFCCLATITMYLKQLEASHIMSWDS